MNITKEEIIEKIRPLSEKYSIKSMNINALCKKINISREDFYTHFENKSDMVQHLLDYERSAFNRIFEKYDFDGVNAIEILFVVSREICSNFDDVSPSITYDLNKYFPTIYNAHVEKRIEFIFDKIKINLDKGIRQGMYRDDLSQELVARLYISRLLDIHNPELFSPQKFSFEVLFDVMFENFIRGIATSEGLAYFEEQKKNSRFIKSR